MKPEKQVTPFAQARRFKELGVKQQSLFYWGTESTYPKGDDPVETPVLYYYEGIIEWGIEPASVDGLYAAYTVAELGVMLPDKIEGYVYGFNRTIGSGSWWIKEDDDIKYFTGRGEAESRAALLIHLLENKIITVEEVNRRLTEA